MPYAELHCRTNFSFLEAASHPEELVARAAELGYRALAITDRNSLAGVVRAYTAMKDLDADSLKLIVGAEITPEDAAAVVLWAKNRRGYANLCRLITRGRRRAAKGHCQLRLDDIAQHTDGLLAGVVPPAYAETLSTADVTRYKDLFGPACYLLAELHRGPHDAYRVAWLKALARQTAVPLVAAGNVLFHVPGRKVLHDVLTAIRHTATVELAGERLLPNAQRCLHSINELRRAFADIPDALRRSLDVAEQCTFSLAELRYEYPEELAPQGQTPMQYLKELAWQGAQTRYPHGVPAKVEKLLHHELRLIEELQYEPYFLTVWDLVRFARERGILCQGRGSAANSAVCYCLGVTAVDPARVEMLFERFISRERDEAPDIDVDFEHERREEVLQYLYEKYGRDRAGLTAVTITYKPRSAIRDVGKALGLSLDLVDRLAKNAGYHRVDDDLPARCRQMGFNPNSDLGRRFVYLVNELIGFPRHLSQHVGGMVITRGPLCELVPIENAAMEGRTVVQWNKDDLDDLGILKVDCLALGMLTAIRKCFALIERSQGERWTLASIPEEDPQVFDMICRADTMGVFQIESRAQMSMLPRLRPRCYYDLVIEVAIVRPGPIQGEMVHPYLRRRRGEEEESYPTEAVRRVLQKTLGVPLFQEQCMQLAVVAAGFTPGEADQLRRAMGAWRRPGVIEQFRRKLLDGMQRQGLNEQFAEQVFQQIRGFGEYGFPESHAASFALLVYVSAWLKYYYPAEFTAAILNSQPMGFYAPAQLVQNARKHQVEVRPVDINRSEWDCSIEDGVLRLGFRLVEGLRQATVEKILQARRAGQFTSMNDFLQRTQLARAEAARLAEADAFLSLGFNRRQALWSALDATDSGSTQLSLFDTTPTPPDDPVPPLPAMTPQEEVHADYRTLSLSLRNHPLAFHREQLERAGVTTAGRLPQCANGMRLKVAGLVLLRQRPSTARGITFVTLEDETGTINLVVHQRTWQRFRKTTQHAQAWLVDGKLETKDSVIHVIARRIEDLTRRFAPLCTKSRDFR